MDNAKVYGLTEDVYRVIAQFKITSKVDVEIIKTRALHEDIESEAIRVINDLPKLIPATLNGQPVNVNYALPIKFKIY
ncbi:energy transducer TonB [Olleya sp. YSTF-M6]|uniref:Energy transducer TonB n=1 Tax=Olleya sediminilitoris TaxID=2795739 RepID=A0ABS1WMF4_9FLAO|nr:energy transducer TonB [Olleya sediminilitoris]MBL7560228.1 energy transducer TonB [Olleya sediminilitoris]